MEKIPNQAALHATVQALQSESALLEKKIRNDWHDLKKSLSPRQMGVQILAGLFSRSNSFKQTTDVAESLSNLSVISSNLIVRSISKFLKKYIN